MALSLLELAILYLRSIKDQRPLGFPPPVTNWSTLTTWVESENLDGEALYLTIPEADRNSMSFADFNDRAEIEFSNSLPDVEGEEG